MRHKIFPHTGGSPSRRLIIIFAGWAMDDKPFTGLSRPGYDIAVVWDYRTLHIDWSFTRPYDEICILAWSMGVYAASMTTQALDYKVSARIAVNGTLCPVDDRRGIPEKIFNGTLDGLDSRNLRKFYRRVCGSTEAFKTFCDNIPDRDVDELRDELDAIATHSILSNPAVPRWDLAIISRDDAIFPPANQQRAWQAIPRKVIAGGHLPDFQKIIDCHFIDKALVDTRFRSGQKTYDANSPVQRSSVDTLAEMVKYSGLHKDISDRRLRILEVGCGTGALSRLLAGWSPRSALEMWDLGAHHPALPPGRFVSCDAETAIWRLQAASLDIIASASTIQWFNSPARFLRECSRVLVKDGLLLLTTYLKGNLHEISDITGCGLPLLSADDWHTIAASTGFTVEDENATETTLDFETPWDALRHLKMTGVNALGRPVSSPVSARNVAAQLRPMLDGMYHLTYRPYVAILKKQ